MAVGLLSCAAGCSDDDTDDARRRPSVAITLGEVTERTIEVNVAAQNAESVAWLCVEDDGAPEPTAAEIFRSGEVSAVSETAESRLIEAEPETSYVIYATALAGEMYSPVKHVKATTPPSVKTEILSFVESSKTSLSYKIDLPEGITYRHTYIEGWYYDALLAENSDAEAVVRQLLVDYGFYTSGPQTVTWRAGDYNSVRDEKVRLVGGHHYYAILSPFASEYEPTGTPEVLRIDLEEAGESPETISVRTDMGPYAVDFYMEIDPQKVNFYFYDMVTKTSYDEVLAEEGGNTEWFREFLFQRGYTADNSRQDRWNTDPGTSYMLLLLGVDFNGDTFFQTTQCDVPSLPPTVDIVLKPYNRELQGHYAYDTFELNLVLRNLPTPVDGSTVVWWLAPKEQVDAMLEMMGMTLDQLRFEELVAIGLPYGALPEDQAAMLTDKGFVRALLKADPWETPLAPDTEYCYIAAIPTGEEETPMQIVHTLAATEPKWGGPDETIDPGYAAYLGEWTATGVSTEDFYTRMNYSLRFEELTRNRSFKVYGWGESGIQTQFPFEVRYNPDTQKYAIEGEQVLGTVPAEGYGELEVRFSGLIFDQDLMKPLSDYSGTFYTGFVDGDYMQCMPEMPFVNGWQHPFVGLNYSFYTTDGKYVGSPERYDLYEFRVSRSVSSGSVPAPRSSILLSSFGTFPRRAECWHPATEKAPAVVRQPRSGAESHTPKTVRHDALNR